MLTVLRLKGFDLTVLKLEPREVLRHHVEKKNMIVPLAIGFSIVDFVEKTQRICLGWTPMRVGKHNITPRRCGED